MGINVKKRYITLEWSLMWYTIVFTVSAFTSIEEGPITKCNNFLLWHNMRTNRGFTSEIRLLYTQCTCGLLTIVTFFHSTISFSRLKRKIPFPCDLAMGFIIHIWPGFLLNSSTNMWYSDYN